VSLLCAPAAPHTIKKQKMEIKILIAKSPNPFFRVPHSLRFSLQQSVRVQIHDRYLLRAERKGRPSLSLHPQTPQIYGPTARKPLS
jgi:hypothetical protein